MIPTLFGIIVCLFCILAAQFIQVHLMRRDFEKDSVLKSRQIQRLDSGIDFQNKRSQFLMVARDSIIKKHNPGLTDDEAYNIAELTLYICEKYKIDPILVFAIGRQESKFTSNAISTEGAKGFFQINPVTGRMLCETLGIEYSDQRLFDLKTNMELAGKYINFLKAEYGDKIDLILIGYNAGPRWADSYRCRKTDLPEETKNYLVRVRAFYIEFDKHLAFYLPGSLIKES